MDFIIIVKNIIGGSKNISSVTSTSGKDISGICQGSSTGLKRSYIGRRLFLQSRTFESSNSSPADANANN